MTIVDDLDEFASALLDGDADAGRTGVNGIFDEFLDDGGGAFDDFAGGDLVDEECGEAADGGFRVQG